MVSAVFGHCMTQALHPFGRPNGALFESLEHLFDQQEKASSRKHTHIRSLSDENKYTIMPSTVSYNDDSRFLMLPVSPARSTDSQLDASSSSKQFDDEEIFITECTSIPPIFRPRSSDAKSSSSRTHRETSSSSPIDRSTFWGIERSYAFDEDDTLSDGV